MTPPIEAILFDVNGTLRASVPCDADRRREKIAGIRELAAIQTPLDELDRLLTRRMQAYRAWARENCRELSETDIWLEWMLPEQPSAVLREVAPTLHQLWREATGIRAIYPEAKDILLELFR